MQSPRFTLNKEDGQNILKVLGYSIASAVLAAILALLAVPNLHLPAYLIPLIPVINVILVAIKKFVDGRTK